MTAPHECAPAPGPLADRAHALRAALPVVKTARLRLDVPDLTDFPVWAEILCGPRSVYMDGPYSRDDAYTEFAAMLGTWVLHGHGVFAVRPLEGGAALGFICLNLEPGDNEPELGFFVTEAAEGQGLVSEAAAAVRDWARAQGIASLVSYIDPANLRSARLAARLGATRDSVAEAAYDTTSDAGMAVYRHWGKAATSVGRSVAEKATHTRAHTDSIPEPDAFQTSKRGA
jgi:RimJ/RimL family protein N-acetyltransferase